MKRIVKNPGREGLFLPLPQQLCCAGRQDDFPRSGIGLGVARYQPAALFPVEGAADFENTAAFVKVRPHEAADLASAQAGGELGVEEVMPDRVCLDGFHESVQLFLIQNIHGLADNFGRFYFVGRIGRDKTLLHRRSECVVERGVDAVDCGAGEPALVRSWIHSAIFLQLVIELSQVCGCDLGEHFLAQIGYNVVCHVLLVVLQGTGAKRG